MEDAIHNPNHTFPPVESGEKKTSKLPQNPVPGYQGGWRIFTLMGIPVFVSPGVFLIILVIGLSLAGDFFPEKYSSSGYGSAVFIAMGAAGAVFFFISILIHEIAHCILARFNNVPVRRISMFILGGMSEMAHEPRTAGSEFAIALAGPAASLALGGALWSAFFALEALQAPLYVLGVVYFVGLMNIILGLTNLLPGFPLDGGRILRALIWLKTRNSLRATRIAGITGRVLGYAGIGTGMVFMLAGGFKGAFFQGMFLVMAGMFVARGARESYEQALLRKALEDVRVADIMHTEIPSVWEELNIAEVVPGYFLRYSVDAFPVVDHLGRLRGMLTSQMLRRLPGGPRAHLKVKHIMAADVLPPVCRPEEKADELYVSMTRYRTPAMAVVGPDGELAGAIMMSDILRAAHIRKQFVR